RLVPCGSRRRRRARRGTRTRASFAVAGACVGEGEPAEEIGELLVLVVAELGAEELLQVGEVRRPRLLELLEPGLGERRVRHAGVGGAVLLLHPARALEAVQETRDPRGAEDDRPRDVDPPHAPARREVDLDEDVVVTQRESVPALQAGGQLPGQGRIRPQKPDPGRRPGLHRSLCAQYLTRQEFLAIFACDLKYTRRCIPCPPSPSSPFPPVPGRLTRCTRTSRSRLPTPVPTRSAAASATSPPPSPTAPSRAPQRSRASTSRTSS